ncbi:hypothetical protein [Pseudobacillus wudalianchiensis]|uniref:Uncharacterized protein n=1 Tax=Pseudobacillus wudalianchiensis TaxID=1743143 RepID=A0A1B9AMP8_9BACI|nr:hypothetical protein [Bacillus wudalianchiensis]OCA85081.1 hypothetical protein A8F95_10345 [Bacillus wudalianchiensis]
MTSIKYGSLKINQITSSSGLFVGTNIQKGRKSKAELNEGFGTIRGRHNKVEANSGVVAKDSKKGTG